MKWSDLLNLVVLRALVRGERVRLSSILVIAVIIQDFFHHRFTTSLSGLTFILTNTSIPSFTKVLCILVINLVDFLSSFLQVFAFDKFIFNHWLLESFAFSVLGYQC